MSDLAHKNLRLSTEDAEKIKVYVFDRATNALLNRNKKPIAERQEEREVLWLQNENRLSM